MVIKIVNILKIFFYLILASGFIPKASNAGDQSYKWTIGEELIYKVKYSFIRLGTLRLVVHDTTTQQGTLLYHTKLYVESNPLIFFVNMHSLYESYIDEQMRVHLFIADEKIDDIPYKAEYRFDYADSIIYQNYNSIADPTNTIIRQVPLDSRIMDGTNLIFYARYRADSTFSDSVMSIYEAERGNVALNFKGEQDEIKIGALKEKQSAYYVDGIIEMKALAGLTGPFKGWFSTDRSRVPLKAKLKVFIGSVSLELEEWINWTPSDPK